MRRKLIFTIFFLWALIASTSVSYAQYGKGVGATKARISRTRGLANRPSYAKTGFRFTIDIDNGFAFPNDEDQNDLGDNPHKPFYELTGTIGCGYQLNPFFYLGVVGGSGFATIETSQPIHIDNWTYEYIFDKKRVMKYLVALDMKAYFRPTRITPRFQLNSDILMWMTAHYMHPEVLEPDSLSRTKKEDSIYNSSLQYPTIGRRCMGCE